MKIFRKVYDWFGKKVNSPYAWVWLFFLTFIESSVFIVPIDPLLILFCIEKPKKSLYFAALSTVASVLGGIFGYIIGAFLWDSVGAQIVKTIISPSVFENARLKYELYQNWAVVIAGFSPLPYKAVTLSAGFCKLPIIPFITYSFLSRGARFFLVAGLIRIWGKQIKFFIDRYFNQLLVLFFVIVIFFVWLLK
mgnify:FL=1|jgi:membrane protein YqaA with SNARE-associated domain